jgi:hypothetical protein
MTEIPGHRAELNGLYVGFESRNRKARGCPMARTQRAEWINPTALAAVVAEKQFRRIDG